MASKVTLEGELMFPNDYLAAVEFKGKDVTLTIAHIERAELQIRGGGKKVKPVVYFKETKKKLVLNVTNGDSIASMYGSEARDWIGKRITLYPTKTQCGRQMVDCIRVREKVPPPPQSRPTAPPPQADPAPDPDLEAALAASTPTDEPLIG